MQMPRSVPLTSCSCISCVLLCPVCAAGVTVEVKARQVRVKGPRGVLSRDFKHLSVDMYLVEEEGQKKLKVRQEQQHWQQHWASLGYVPVEGVVVLRGQWGQGGGR